jgi:type IV pilus assembly protein PilC
MAQTLLEGSAISAFCGGIAVMIAAGIQVDEAVYMLGDEHEDSQFKSLCQEVYMELIGGCTLAEAMGKTQAFPEYAVSMVEAGEKAGRLEQVLQRLDIYYEEEERTYQKLRSSVSYPAALLGIMSVILFFAVAFILPVFLDVYENLTGTLTSGSFSAMGVAIAIGWIALIITIIGTAVVCFMSWMSTKESGRLKPIEIFEKLPFTRSCMYQLALSRFTAALSTYISSGVDTETAMSSSAAFVTNAPLRAKVDAAYEVMIDTKQPRSLAQAIAEKDVFEPLYARMLTVGIETGSSDDMLARLSEIFFEDAIERIDRIINHIEPLFAAFLTVTVGATLISVMLPLIGIMRSIG